MDAAREDLLERLFGDALALTPAERDAFLARECGADAELRSTLEGLFASAAAAGDFVDRIAGPAAARVAGAIVGERDPLDEATESAALVGQRLSHFRILEQLGAGGMGCVYRAVDLRLDRVVALKLLPTYLTSDERARRRLLQEARAASALDHPGICALHEIGEAGDGRLFLAMTFCEGETLERRIARGPLPLREALDYAVQIAEALECAHRAGIVHRDVKPANVMITGGGRVKMVDFGVAKVAGTDLTPDGARLGTVAYMSPEQTRGVGVDARADLWSLGAVLHEMITGRRPFVGESDEAVIHAIRLGLPRPARDLRAVAPSGVAAVVERCLSHEIGRRHGTAAELLAELRAVNAEGSAARPARRRRLAMGAMIAAALALPFVGAAVLRARPRPVSVAVVGVADSAGGEADAFATELTGLVTTHLSELGGMQRVVSLRAAEAVGAGPRPGEAGRDPGVSALVTISVRRRDSLVRLDASLVEPGAARARWRRSFERPIREVLTLPREAARAIAAELRVPVTERESARLAAAREVHPQAFSLYLQAARAGDLRDRTRLLEQALARDSSFALAHAKVALDYVMRHERVRADRAIATALRLDPALSDAYDALGLLRMWIDWDWSGAEVALRRAIELNPHSGLAHHELGQLLARLARCDEAVGEGRRAVLASPGASHYQSGLAEVHLHCRRFDDAIAELERTLPLVRDSSNVYVLLGDAHFYRGDHRAALAMYERSRRPVPGWAFAALGDRTVAERQIAELTSAVERGEGTSHATATLARLHASLGQRDQAIEWLERALEEKGWIVVYLKVHPHFDALRDDARFRAILRMARLAA